MYKEFIDSLKSKGIEDILIDEPMKNHTTFKIGGPADIMVIPKNEEELILTIREARDLDLNILILGNGSNMLVRDKGIRAVVIKLNTNYSEIEKKGEELICQSGAILPVVSKRALRESLEGLEFASGIPGTLGGAVTMNAGAYGGEMKDVVKSVRVLDENLEIKEIENKELDFRYRGSLIKDKKYIVLSVSFELKEGNYDEIKEKMDDFTYRRTSKQPLEFASGGSTFKRPTGYYAGKLIDDSGLRGIRYKDAQVSEKHCGFVINRGEASCEDILTLIGSVQKTVRDKFGVELEREIMLLGEE